MTLVNGAIDWILWPSFFLLLNLAWHDWQSGMRPLMRNRIDPR